METSKICTTTDVPTVYTGLVSIRKGRLFRNPKVKRQIRKVGLADSLNRLELSAHRRIAKRKIAAGPGTLDRPLFICFSDHALSLRARFGLDLETTEDSIHGNQKGLFLRGSTPAAIAFRGGESSVLNTCVHVAH